MRLLKILIFMTTISLLCSPAMAASASSKAEAARVAQSKTSGRVLKVEQQGNVYRVKILQDSGRVVSVVVKKVDDERRKGKAQ